MEYDIKQAKETAEELYMSVPIGVLRYITCLEEKIKQLNIPVVVGQSEQLVYDKNKLDCPYDFTSRCTMGRCDCEPKVN